MQEFDAGADHQRAAKDSRPRSSMELDYQLRNAFFDDVCLVRPVMMQHEVTEQGDFGADELGHINWKAKKLAKCQKNN